MQGSDNETLWQKYPQEAHVVTWNTTFDASDHVNLASKQLLPYNCSSGGSVDRKPIRRRSRASKKTPTTLLKVNPRNFRALVQQFTGCDGAPSTCYKGPVTLNFEHGSSCRSGNHQNSHKERSELVSFRTNYINSINAFPDEPKLFDSTVALTTYSPNDQGDSLTLENLDMENFLSGDLRGPEVYSTPTWEATAARNDDSWSNI